MIILLAIREIRSTYWDDLLNSNYEFFILIYRLFILAIIENKNNRVRNVEQSIPFSMVKDVKKNFRKNVLVEKESSL